MTATIVESLLEDSPEFQREAFRLDAVPEPSQLPGRRCPEPSCGAPATVIDRFVLDSTDGPVVVLKTRCSRRHWFTVPEDQLSPAYRDGSATFEEQHATW
jgi:hypothetical protein